MISFEQFSLEKHYNLAVEWWKANGMGFLPPSHLSQTGVVVLLDSAPAAMCWIFKTDSAFCLIEFLVIDPSIRRQVRTQVLNSLIGKAKDVAADMGFKTAFITTDINSFISRLKTNGFVVADTGMTNLTCNIGG